MTDIEPLLPSNVRKIAIFRPNAVGDFIFALPCLHALKNRYSEAEITYIGKQWHADFLTGRPGPVDRVAVMPLCPGIGLPPDAPADPQPVRQFIERMRDEQFDLALQIYGGGRYSNPLVLDFGARLAIGMKAQDAVPLDRWITYTALQNRRLQMLEVAALVGANVLQMDRELLVTDQDRQEAARVLPADTARPIVVLHPGSTDRRRCWPAEQFAAVGDMFASEGAIIAVNGIGEEVLMVRAVIEKMRSPAVDLSGKLSLSGLCGLLKQASLLVSNDSGPLHLAVAIGTPSVGIYWLTNLVESGPLQQGIHRAALSLRTHCTVCGTENRKRRCEHDASFVDDVPFDDVCALASELFQASTARRRQARTALAMPD